MSKRLNRNLYRALLIITFVAVNAFVIWGISFILGYLNTGADRSTMLHAEVFKEEVYQPKVTWDISNQEGRPMDKQTLQEVENNYLKAWYVRNVAYQTNNIHGIADFYTDSARVNLYRNIQQHKDNFINIETTTTSHQPKVEFFSADGQLVVLTDEQVIEYQKVFQNHNLMTVHQDTSAYQVMLLLEDGFWRIRHLVRTNPKLKQLKKVDTSEIIVKGKQLFKEGKPFLVKGINYYPQKTPWDMFGENFDEKIISKDFKFINNEGLNSIRIFIQYEDFGKAEVLPEKLNKLKKVLDLAEENELKVVVTLFDFYGDYSVLDWTLTHRHAEKIVSAFKNHSAILAWDIKNEPDLDFESRNKQTVIAWLSHIIDEVKFYDPNHLVTIGWSNPESATHLSDKVDFVSFHFYKDLSELPKDYQLLNKKVSKPLVLQEYGMSSYHGLWNFWGTDEQDQANYHQKMQAFLKKEELAFMSWTLYDFTQVPSDVVGKLPWRKSRQKHFGFLDIESNPKPALKFISN
ncbi:glycoside hydrolase family 2 TIM barrel-domain containing protein [Mesonia aestuariivivens]|uniref:Cellulase family glycosylhydrolase n=1 Tax=Mesonia aestuariivivens TaxID=2796128 RepID=A0ABS6W4T9_9FLAO|nr:glycoside hydrolase family 2 TIM barrel-domain containing protein [Mesonia aestuariivivens]MBW2962829.1 cellulase family glycosylhydrolase [Mesonia aestuariivivens]